MTLGFTFYPKDWWASDSFYILNPFERYLYLELLFMMYANDGLVTNDRVMIEARLRTAIREDSWEKVTSLLINDGDWLTHKSVNKRLAKTLANRENGKKGGRPRKPKKPNSETQKNPRLEREKKGKRKEREEKFSPPTILEVQEYFSQNGYSSLAAQKAFSYYDTAGWKDSKGNQVKNWKQKMIAVWFKDENKLLQKDQSQEDKKKNHWQYQ